MRGAGEEPEIRELKLTESIFQELAELSRNIYFFEGIPVENLNELCQDIGLFEFPADTSIVRQGSPGDSFFLMYSGRAKVRVKRGFLRGTLEVATLVRGHVFGEMALVNDDHKRRASIRAKENTFMMAFEREALEQLAADEPAIGLEVYRALAGALAKRLSVASGHAAHFKAMALKHN